MAYDKFQNESPLPAGKQVKKLSVDFLPKFFRTEANRKFLQGTMDQLIAPGVAEKLSGYIGRKTAKAYSPKDNYIGDFTEERENYQLEPAAVIKDNLDNVTFYKDYNESNWLLHSWKWKNYAAFHLWKDCQYKLFL